MRNTQELTEFVEKWKGECLPSKEMLHDYFPLCRWVMYQEEELVREVVSLLRSNIKSWASSNSPVYAQIEDEILTRERLMDGSRWHAPSVSNESARMSTSGSTTGYPFGYLRWDPSLYPIEADNHYDLVMDEFGMPRTPHILNMFNSKMYDSSLAVTVREDSQNFMDHHGLKRRAFVHYVNFKAMERDRQSYMRHIMGHLVRNRVDVIFAPGSTINALCDAVRKSKRRDRLCSLVSNTNERLLPSDREFLLDGRAEWVCDHMRCWDGGASFFTCRHGTYHLMDNLSWAEESEGRLVCTDYFNLASPFVRYWNGDYCSISNSYTRCVCGRLFRPFEFMESRPFSLKGLCILDIRKKIESLSVLGIKRVLCGLNTIDVVSSEKISDENMRAIEAVAENFKFRFLVE